MKKLTDLLQITRNGMGSGAQELSHKLLKTYLRLIAEDNRLPSIIVFYNEGVKVLDESNGYKEELLNLEQKGCKLIACTTCLNYYNIEPVAGIKGTMPDIITLQSDADKVITL
ncbi:DsrE family protein [Carboxylicivirga sp. A043]|uniref:DsrE family protein n=1 Tax=Carboxylicivirga litoralis TaxID=2816963 RepID=UPI0021CAEF21|nr:DsrE family protein [Carboxylicivirga sp. A043]MCU4157314.1 DsrE family protein [Carboxylicivirga sp. A043]